MGARRRDFSIQKNGTQDSKPGLCLPMSQMMTTRRKFQPKHFFLLSMLLHALFTLGVFVSTLNFAPKHVETIQMEIVEAPIAQAVPAKDAKNKKTMPILKNQVVDQDDRALNDEKPEDARFLSAHNQVVKKQTVAQNRGEFKNKSNKETEVGHKGAAKKPSLQDFKPTFDIAKAVEKQVEREKEFDKLAADGFLKPKSANAEKSDLAGEGERPKSKGGDASQTLDYIKDLDPGLETLLSTKEFVYYSYFNRIRGRLNQYWSDKVRQKITDMYRKGRSIASSDDKITKCLITLDTTGNLLKVQIIGNSGVYELDEAAVEAFKAAAPFLNPPKGMIDSDGTIKIRWDFILEA